MGTQSERSNRRMKRTRWLLRQAFMDVMQEKGFTSMRIQDITERADVNRGTFYVHFADKYALLESISREDFQHLLASKLPSKARWERNTLRLLTQTVFEYVQAAYGHCHPSNIIDPLIERVIPEELTALLLTWLRRIGSEERYWRVPKETIALSASWTIFGAAIQWSREATTLSSEQMANDVVLVLMEGMARLVSDALRERATPERHHPSASSQSIPFL